MYSVPITTGVASLFLVYGEFVLVSTVFCLFVSDLYQVGGFLLVPPFPPPIKLAVVNITEIVFETSVKNTFLSNTERLQQVRVYFVFN